MGKGYKVLAKADDDAEIFLYEDVGDSWFGGVSAKQFAADLNALGNVKNIALRINSYGGDVFEGLAIYRQLADHKAKVTAHIDGVAASIASIIAMSANKILIAEAGFLMIHNAAGAVMGEADDMRRMAETLDTVTGTLRGVYEARTRHDDAKIREWMDAETWFTGADAVAEGFADEIVPNVKVTNHLTADLRNKHNFRHAPQVLVGRPAASNARDRVERMAAKLRLSAPKAA